MATQNDFKKLNIKCKKIFDLAQLEGAIPKNITIDEDNKKRFGFYYLIIQELLNIDNFASVTGIITDTDFNAKVFNSPINDEGIDAVYIDEETNTISLFNFKFRPKWNTDKSQSINETIVSSKYLNILQTENNTASGKLKSFTDTIISKNNSDEVWNTILYVVSNENQELSYSTAELKNLRDVYNIDTRCIGLDTIVEMTSLHPNPVCSKILVPADSILTYSEDPISTDKSYVLCARLTELVRMTCNNADLRLNITLEDESVLSTTSIEMNVLYENVRGYIAKSKFNQNILNTLCDEPEKFYFYNNGLTIVAKDIVAERTNSTKKWKLTINDFQVLNGGQTLRTIHKFAAENPDNIQKLSDASVQVRIIKVNEDDLKSKISEYTNSQNAISVIDLKSMRKEQVDLEEYLSNFDILYIRKTGNTGKENKAYTHCITLQKLGQVLFAISGNPGQVSNKRQSIFTIHYDELFCSDNLLSQNTVDYIKAYYSILEKYKSIPDFFELKVFFVLYLSVKLGRSDYDALIGEFDSFVESRKSSLKPSRRLIQPTFFSELNAYFKIQ